MQFPNTIYRPRGDTIVVLDVSRNAGHRSNSIHMHDHHEIVLVTSPTSCELTSNGNTLCIKTPAIWINRAGSFHEVTQVQEGTYHSQVIFFHPALFEGLPEEMCYQNVLFKHDFSGIHLNKKQLQRIIPLFQLLHDGSASQQRLLLLSILCQMAEFIEQDCPLMTMNLPQSYIFDVILHLQTNKDKITIPQLSDHFHVSATKLKKDFKRITGMTIGIFMNQLRLQRAKTMLETTKNTVSEIAYACGYSDQSYFIETFRKHYDITPGALRSKLHSKHRPQISANDP